MTRDGALPGGHQCAVTTLTGGHQCAVTTLPGEHQCAVTALTGGHQCAVTALNGGHQCAVTALPPWTPLLIAPRNTGRHHRDARPQLDDSLNSQVKTGW